MAKIITDNRYYKEIANALRTWGPETTGDFKPSEMANQIVRTADYRQNVGYNDGIDAVRGELWGEGYAAGYDEGWDDGFYNGWDAGFDEGRERTSKLLSGQLTYYYDEITTSITTFSFAYKTELELAALYEAASSGHSVFAYCSNLKRAALPVYTGSLTDNFFIGDAALELVEFGCVSNVGPGAFSGCEALNTLILRKDSPVTLTDINAFEGTPCDNGGSCKIFVPETLIEEYKNAPNWSTLYARGSVEFIKLENSKYESIGHCYTW